MEKTLAVVCMMALAATVLLPMLWWAYALEMKHLAATLCGPL